MSEEGRTRIAAIYRFLKELDRLRRPSSGAFGATIDRILEDLERREELPESLQRLVGVDAAAEGVGSSVDNEVLLSKEVNEEQLRVARRLQTHGSVLVQGPPGNG